MDDSFNGSIGIIPYVCKINHHAGCVVRIAVWTGMSVDCGKQCPRAPHLETSYPLDAGI